jgi:hypothetical protein
MVETDGRRVNVGEVFRHELDMHGGRGATGERRARSLRSQTGVA